MNMNKDIHHSRPVGRFSCMRVQYNKETDQTSTEGVSL